MIDTLTLIIVVMGIMTIALSLFVGWKFLLQHLKMSGGNASCLTSALSWQLFGEGIIGVGTLAFAIAAHTGHLPNWEIWIQSSLRFIMFAATSLTTLHLYITIRRILHDSE